jgi:predicted lipid carrier protein YhbT
MNPSFVDAPSSRGPSLPPFAALPQPVQQLVKRGAAVVRRLPLQPPSFVAARLLDRALLPRLDAAQRRALVQRPVEVEVIELGLRVRLLLTERGFAVASTREKPAVVIRARADALWRLVRGQDDADRLFFERALVMQGDTELGLVLKNTLDAIGPLWA